MSYLQVVLNGKQYGMTFDFGMLENLEEITGKPYSQYSFDGTTAKTLREGIAPIVHAAILSHDETQVIEADQVKLWLKKISFGDMSKIALTYTDSFKSPAAGESGKDTQPQ